MQVRMAGAAGKRKQLLGAGETPTNSPRSDPGGSFAVRFCFHHRRQRRCQ